MKYTILLLTLLACNGLAAQPNFLIITADDMNWDSVGCYGTEPAKCLFLFPLLLLLPLFGPDSLLSFCLNHLLFRLN